jgi:DNA mismatch repair protein MutS2
MGSLRFREKVTNLELLERAPEKAPGDRGARLQQMAAARGTEVRLRRAPQQEVPSAELKVIGQTTDEAVDAVDKFLDEAYIQSFDRVRIVHGHGTGALRRAIADLLRGHPHVANFTPAPPDQGGAGATLVELKQ